MKTLTITDAKKQLGALLKQAIDGQEIGIICGAEIVALRRVKVQATDGPAAVTVAPPAPVVAPVRELLNTDSYDDDPFWGVGLRLREDSGPVTPGDDWFFRSEGYDSGPGAGDAAAQHDHYLYGNPRR